MIIDKALMVYGGYKLFEKGANRYLAEHGDELRAKIAKKVDTLLFGESRKPYASYNKYVRPCARYSSSKPYGRRWTSNEFVPCETSYDEAKTILSALYDHIDEYGSMTVAEYYEYCSPGVLTWADFDYWSKYGWRKEDVTDVEGKGYIYAVKHDRSGQYTLNLPEPVKLS